MPSLNDLEQYLIVNSIGFKKDSRSNLCFTLNVPMSSGKRKAFELTATQSDSELLIKESGGCLPNFCPNRHINMGGYFCLGLKVDSLEISDWISNVKKYLRAQVYVNKHQTWPKNIEEWSHGNAAHYQELVENGLIKLRGNNLNIEFRKIELKEVSPTKCCQHQPHYHLYYDSKLIATGIDNKVLNKRAPCICITDGSAKRKHKTIGGCKNECLKTLYQIPFNEKNRFLEDNKFWNYFKNQKCCMTMSICRLNKQIS